MSKTLILLRHAHRDNSDRSADNGLSDKGKEQAKSIRRFFLERFDKDDLEDGLWVVSSPKKRCQETISPVTKELKHELDIHPDLSEHAPGESFSAFQARIERFLREWKNSKAGITVVVSHSDWLPLAVQSLYGKLIEFKKGAWVEFEADQNELMLKWCIPTFKPFYK